MVDCDTFAREVFSAVDTMDFSRLRPFLTEDCVFRFANMPAAHGCDAFEAGANQFTSFLSSLRHDVGLVIASDNDVASKATVHYERKDGFKLSCPACSVWRLRDGKIWEYDVFVDNSQLFS
ncbi:hypothetical protein CAF53_25925 (plasmid) [Sphingobium sp. LB126]|uniref:nuclear transport factor 2 family protein n=1 Tax=Sphingobium sp. LB126 TaxID=1983755 RepID=UPI000C1FE7CD|nr:nuclear transport factor 2 family protein [Sphingobium sp. LB126]PJG45061.1 hypothetical protein CAF53_25925 [Sphingobium sp. LB126]